jgi:DNA-binding transcriptional ArsR family regulator
MTDDTSSLSSVRLNPRNLKGLAHPLRVKLLGALREGGPATASLLAARLGESSGATSYHLRQLAEFGFIEEDREKASGRERWWRAAHETSYLDEGSMARDPDFALLGTEYLRAVAKGTSARMLQWIEALPTLQESWAEAGTISDWALRLTPEEARRLEAELQAVIERYPRFNPEEEEVEGRAFVAAQIQILPHLR